MTTPGRVVLPSSEPTFNAQGVLSSGASLTVYLTGTTTPANLYSSATLGTLIDNPQTSNAAGYFYAQTTSIWADASVAYDYVLSLPTGEMYQYPDQYLLGPQASGSGYLQNPSVVLTGNPTAPTPAANNASASIATTQFVATALATYATLASPSFTGTPLAPTATPGDTSTQIATDAFVAAAITAAISGGLQIIASAYIKISGTTLSIAANVGFSSIIRSSAGAYNFAFSSARPDTNYRFGYGVENTTQLACMFPQSSKTTSGFAASILTYNNISNDPAGLTVTIFE